MCDHKAEENRKTMMKLEDIQAFIAFVQLQSTSLAAEQLGISQPAVTRRIQNLEQVCAVQLFDRQTRPLKLTARGREIYNKCCVIENEVNSLKQVLLQQNQEKISLRIGLPNSLLESGILATLGELKQEFPSAQLEISSGWGKDLLAKLQDGQLDGLIANAKQPHDLPKQYQAKVMGTLHIRPMVNKRLAKAGVSTWQDLQELGWVLNNEGCGFRSFLENKLMQHHQTLNLKVEVIGAGLQLDLVKQSIGAGFFAQELVKHHPHCAELTTIETQELNLDMLVYHAYRDGLSMQQIELFELVMQRFQQKISLS